MIPAIVVKSAELPKSERHRLAILLAHTMAVEKTADPGSLRSWLAIRSPLGQVSDEPVKSLWFLQHTLWELEVVIHQL
jgi:hypothetical protein